MSEMTTTNNLPDEINWELMLELIATGDVSKLTPAKRNEYIIALCKHVGLNPTTKPFDLLELNGKTVVYANKNCGEQLRQNKKISIKIVEDKVENGFFKIRVQATSPDGRVDEDVSLIQIPVDQKIQKKDGGVWDKKSTPEDYANAYMKAVTKAKRRVTLSICGLGMMDETEIETIRSSKPVIFDFDNGNIEKAIPQQETQSPIFISNDQETRKENAELLKQILKLRFSDDSPETLLRKENVKKKCKKVLNLDVEKSFRLNEYSNEQIEQILDIISDEFDSSKPPF